MKKGLLYVAALLFSMSVCYAQEPARMGWMGALGKFPGKGMAIDSVMEGGTLYKLGVQKGDTLLSLNGVEVTDAASYNGVAGKIRSGGAVSATYKRGSKLYTKKNTAAMRRYETSEYADVIYGWAKLDDCSLRTIVRRPKGKTNTPAVLLIPGYNCGTIENFGQGYYHDLLNAWNKAGYTVVTIEKTGIGDSYGCIPCMEVDLATDIKLFDEGYKYMEGLPYVDKKNLFIWGHSMGGVIAPIVAERHQPKGVIAYATVYRPWSEFLLEMHRVQLPLDGKSFAETEDYVRKIQKIYYEFFRLKKSPDELYQNPEYRDMLVSDFDYKPGTNSTNMWGRHWRFWQQLDSIDLARSWGNVNAKVLSVFGGADFIACSEIEHQLIVRTVNSTHPGNAEFMLIPDVDHLLVQHKDWASSHKYLMDAAYRSQHLHQGFPDSMVAWMNKRVRE